MMRCFLDLSNDSFTVSLEWTGHNHKPHKMQITFQSITSHFPNLQACDTQFKVFENTVATINTGFK